MWVHKLAAIVMLVLALLACGGSDETAELAPSDKAAGSFDELTGTLDRAGEVDQLSRARKGEIDDTLDERDD